MRCVNIRLSLGFFLFIVGFQTQSGNAQIGGRGVYGFLNAQPSPRLAALGGAPIAINDSDPNIGFYLPSQLSETMHNHVSMNYVNYFSDINIGQVNYARHYDNAGTFSAGMLYTNYGQFLATDERGNELGEFRAADYAFQLGYGLRRGRWSHGISSKLIYSQLETYKSLGSGVDFSTSYSSDSGLFCTALLVRNIGLQWVTYDGNRESLPYEIQWSFSKKLKHAPLRLIAVLHNLQTWKIAYVNSNDRSRNINFDNPDQEPKIGFADNAFRHVILATELVFSPNFMARLAYNHQRRMEMTWEQSKGFTGFSWGIGMKIARFRFDYGMATFFAGKSTHQFAITLNMNEFQKK